MEEKKKVGWEVDGGKIKIKVDLNEDGDALLELSLDLAEVLDEIVAAFKDKKEEPQA